MNSTGGLLTSLLLGLSYTLPMVKASPTTNCASSLPGLVDLGYSKHVPGYINTTATGKRVAVYRNIRFGNPPTGNLRFRGPDTNLPYEDGVQDGLLPWGSTDCIASAPASVPFPGVNGTAWGHEDCLFLDVYVPEGVRPGDKVPVIHWYFGSAYAFGSKDVSFSSIGLFDRADDEHKFIFVTNNYRLGLPGWTWVPGLDMDANVGLLDCLAATEWTAKYIEKFGGDPNRVTVMGQSAGAGISNLLTTWNGGEGTLPFQQAFLSSPDVPPRRHEIPRQEELFQAVLNVTNCTDLECLRSVPEEVIFEANNLLISYTASDAGGGVFGPGTGFSPVPDGLNIPDMPLVSFRQGRFHKELRSLIVGNMANEGMGLADDTDMPARFPIIVRQVIPGASNSTIAALEDMYSPLSVPAELAWEWITDIIFACNAYNLASAYADKTMRYIMSLPPATHGEDGYYYFYINQTFTPVEAPEVAAEFQARLLDFVYGEETGWPIYGAEEQLFNVTADGFVPTTLPEHPRARCETVNAAFLNPVNGV